MSDLWVRGFDGALGPSHLLRDVVGRGATGGRRELDEVLDEEYSPPV